MNARPMINRRKKGNQLSIRINHIGSPTKFAGTADYRLDLNFGWITGKSDGFFGYWRALK